MLIRISYADTTLLIIINQTAVIVSSYFSLWGCESMTGRKIHPSWLYVSIAALLWVIMATIHHIPVKTMAIPNFVLSGAIYIWTGIILLVSKEFHGKTILVVSICFILWGLHKFDYPFLVHIKNIAPWGFQLSSVLSLFVAVGILLLYFQKNKRNLMLSQQSIEKSLNEKNVLIKEVHHRVKNNLQIISSLINLQEDIIEDKNAKKALLDAKNRIRAIGLVHEKIYQQKQFSKVEINTYIKNLGKELLDSFNASSKVKLHLKIKQTELSLEKTIPIGQIITELVTNSLKYAFPENKIKEPFISINFSQDAEGNMHLIYKDNGIGIKKKEKLASPKTMGHNLIDILCKQIKAALSTNWENGVEFEIKFKDS